MTTATAQAGSEAPRGLISLKTAAALMDVDPKTIRNWISAGHLRGYRVNARMLRVDRNELMALVEPLSVQISDGVA